MSSGQKSLMQRYLTTVDAINALEPRMQGLSDPDLQRMTGELRARHTAGETLEALLPEAFAVVREASHRVLGLRPYDCQLVGAMVLHEGRVAEMKTGEGKTLVATLPAYLNALTGEGVHVVTVNSYLARRDAEWVGRVHTFLGLTVAVAAGHDQPDGQMNPAAERAAFAADITYTTARNLVFQYLQAKLATRVSERLMEPDALAYAIVDEADNVLIDECSNPYLLSQPNLDLVCAIDAAMAAARGLRHAVVKGPDDSWEEVAARAGDFIVDKKFKQVTLTETGTWRALQALRAAGELPPARPGAPDSGHELWQGDTPFGPLVQKALAALHTYERDVEYIVLDGAAVIVDSSTGRLQQNSRWTDNMHQFVEAKEGLEVRAENETVASTTFQQYFRQYAKLCGMTGTAATERLELHDVYRLEVVEVPPNRPSRRIDVPSRMYLSKELKFKFLVDVLKQAALHPLGGRPVLIGTASVGQSEEIVTAIEHLQQSASLDLQLNLLNAKPENVKIEAQLVALAGVPGRVTIATNMAGRGTDILLGGDPGVLGQLYLLRMFQPLFRTAADGSTIPFPQLRVEAFPELDAMADMASAAGQLLDITNFMDKLPEALLGVLLRAAAVLRVSASAGNPAAMHGCNSYEEVDAYFKDIMRAAQRVLQAVTERRGEEAPLPSLHHMLRASGLSWVDAAAIDVDTPEAVAELQRGMALDFGSQHWLEAADAVLSEVDLQVSQELLTGRAERLALVKAAAMLSLYLEARCGDARERVHAMGGLLVVGSAANNTARVDNQLRGRAGRQGDPGCTMMIYDPQDPLLVVNLGIAAGLLAAMPDEVDYVDGRLVDQVVQQVQDAIQSQTRGARLQLTQVDRVLAPTRRHYYDLRAQIAFGGGITRRQLIYGHLQELADLALLPFTHLQHRCPAAHTHEWAYALSEALLSLREMLTPPSGQDNASLGMSFGVSFEADIMEQEECVALLQALTGQTADHPEPSRITSLGANLAHMQSRRLHGLTSAKAVSEGSVGAAITRGAPYSREFGTLRERLGTGLVATYEAARLFSLSQQDGASSGHDPAWSVDSREVSVLLDQLEASWRTFMDSVKDLESAANLKAFSNLEPLQELSIDANDLFFDTMRECRVASAVALLQDLSSNQWLGRAG